MADENGFIRQPFSFVEDGVFKGFAWGQDAADEYDQEPTGHSVPPIIAWW